MPTLAPQKTHRRPSGILLPAGLRDIQVVSDPLPQNLRPKMAGGAARTYMAFHAAMPTAAAPAKLALTAALKTVLQIQTGAAVGLRVIEWGVSFDASAAGTPVQAELLTTAAVAATVTAYVAADIVRMNGPNDAASSVVLGTAASGFAGSAEGVVAATRMGDLQLIAPTNQYLKQFPLGREFEVPVSTNLRIRLTPAAAVNAYAYVVWEE